MSTASDLDSEDSFVNISGSDCSSEVDVTRFDEPSGRAGVSWRRRRVLDRSTSVAGLTLNTRRRREVSRERESEPPEKRTRLDSDSIPDLKLSSFAGYKELVSEVQRLLEQTRQAEVYHRLGVGPPKGLLLWGPHGCGKTLLVRAIAGHLSLPLFTVSGLDLLCYTSHAKIRNTFEMAGNSRPAVVFLDGLDAIGDRKDMVVRLAAAMDDLQPGVMVVGTCLVAEVLDSALRMTGRFDREIGLGIPTLADREAILITLTSGLKLEKELSLKEIAAFTPGFVGGDLKSLTSEAGITAIMRAMDAVKDSSTDSNHVSLTDDQIEALYILRSDFMTAIKKVQPSTKRRGFASVPDVTWEDIGSLKKVKKQLETSILLPVKYPEKFTALGIESSAGILLCGPPGCGKTLLGKAIANESGINFLSVKGPELLNMYVGESERGVRQCFQRAKACRPCVVFVDEIDALCPRRYGTTGEASSSIARVVNQFLTEMDGVEERSGVFVLAATNRPDVLDPAILRPGRFEKVVWVGLPTAEDRAEILSALTRRVPLADVDIDFVAKDSRLNGFSGADLSALVKESCVAALSQHLVDNSELRVTTDIMLEVASKLRPSVSERELSFYRQIKKSIENTKRNSQNLSVSEIK